MAEAQMETEILYLPLDIVQASPGFTCDFGECCFCIQKVKMVKNPSLEEERDMDVNLNFFEILFIHS